MFDTKMRAFGPVFYSMPARWKPKKINRRVVIC